MAFLKAAIFTGGQRKGKAKIKYCISRLTIPLKTFVLEEAYLLEDPNHICPFNTDYWLSVIMINKEEIGSDSQHLVIQTVLDLVCLPNLEISFGLLLLIRTLAMVRVKLDDKFSHVVKECSCHLVVGLFLLSFFGIFIMPGAVLALRILW